jgi:hypothetical protein
MGNGSRSEGRQLTRFLSWSSPSETSPLSSLREHLLCVHSPVGGCASFFFPSFSDLLGAISGSARHELLGGCGERGGEIEGGLGLFKRMKADRYFAWGISWRIADWKHGFYPQVTAGLNNHRLDSDLLFRRGMNRQRDYSEAERSFGGFLDTLFD